MRHCSRLSVHNNVLLINNAGHRGGILYGKYYKGLVDFNPDNMYRCVPRFPSEIAQQYNNNNT